MAAQKGALAEGDRAHGRDPEAEVLDHIHQHQMVHPRHQARKHLVTNEGVVKLWTWTGEIDERRSSSP